jgi:hypothetical protein
MSITRKQALVALVGGLVPWIARRANAADAAAAPARTAPPPVQPTVTLQKQVDDLTRRVAALEAQLANQVGFTKDASGHLTLHTASSVTIQSGGDLSLKSSGMAKLAASGNVQVQGALIHLN